MIRQYLGKFIFVALVVGILGLAWGLKGTQFGQDLAGGAELRYRVTQRVTQRYDKLRRHLSDLNDPAKVQAKGDRVAEIKRLLGTATGDRREKLENEKVEIEFSLNRKRILEELKDLEQQRQAVAAPPARRTSRSAR